MLVLGTTDSLICGACSYTQRRPWLASSSVSAQQRARRGCGFCRTSEKQSWHPRVEHSWWQRRGPSMELRTTSGTLFYTLQERTLSKARSSVSRRWLLWGSIVLTALPSLFGRLKSTQADGLQAAAGASGICRADPGKVLFLWRLNGWQVVCAKVAVWGV